MSWGIKITVLYLGFVAMILTMVFLCMGQTVDLESKDYYAKELKYQSKIDAIQNSDNLKNNISYEITASTVILRAPSDIKVSDLSGELLFFRPSDASKDLKLPLAFDSAGEQIIEKKLLASGIYKMQVNWQRMGKDYFKEFVINIKK